MQLTQQPCAACGGYASSTDITNGAGSYTCSTGQTGTIVAPCSSGCSCGATVDNDGEGPYSACADCQSGGYASSTSTNNGEGTYTCTSGHTGVIVSGGSSDSDDESYSYDWGWRRLGEQAEGADRADVVGDDAELERHSRRLQASDPYAPNIFDAVRPALMDCGSNFPDAPFTIEAFVNVDAPPPGSFGVETKILVGQSFDANITDMEQNFGISWYLGTVNGAPVFSCASSTASAPVMEVVAPSTTNAYGTWQNFAVVVGLEAVTLYQDGVQVATATFYGPLLPVSRLMLGGYGHLVWFNEAYQYSPFKGLVDEVRVFAGVRTAGEISGGRTFSGSLRAMPSLVRLYNIRWPCYSTLSACGSGPSTLRDATGLSQGCVLSGEAKALQQSLKWKGASTAGLTIAPPSPPPLPSTPPPTPLKPPPSPPPSVPPPSPPPPAPPPAPCPEQQAAGASLSSAASGCGADYGPSTLYSSRFEHATFDGKTSFDCAPVPMRGAKLTFGFAMKPANAYTGSVVALNRADGSPYLTVSIEVGGWITADLVIDAATGNSKEATLKEAALLGAKTAGKTWVTCNVRLDFEAGQLQLICGDHKGEATISQEEVAAVSVPPDLRLSLGCADAHKTAPKALRLSKGFEGAIDDVRLWDVKLRNSQIKVNGANELSGDESGLAAYYRLGEEINSDLQVLDGNGGQKHCTLYRYGGLKTENEHFEIVAASKRRIALPDPPPVLKSGGRRRRKLQEAAPRKRALSTILPPQRSCLEHQLSNPAAQDGIFLIDVNGTAAKARA